MLLWQVILERGPLATKHFAPENGHRAFDRTHALCELHGGCQFTQDQVNRTLTVHASKHYKDQQPKGAAMPNLMKNGTGSTGQRYEFLVTMEKADGSDKRIETVTVIGTSTADAWQKIGCEVYDFMTGPKGRKVTDVQLN